MRSIHIDKVPECCTHSHSEYVCTQNIWYVYNIIHCYTLLYIFLTRFSLLFFYCLFSSVWFCNPILHTKCGMPMADFAIHSFFSFFFCAARFTAKPCWFSVYVCCAMYAWKYTLNVCVYDFYRSTAHSSFRLKPLQTKL